MPTRIPTGGQSARMLLTALALGATAACLTACSAAEDRSYRDGTYTADGSYAAPSGNETITVELTLEHDAVSAVTVTPHATGGNAAKFQGQFAEGIAVEVLGKDIDTLAVSRVAGSSLTSGGFQQALDAIKVDALEP